ncbi:helix-turn-helix domain-containing protein [Parabacteroides sp. OttesenSCG-928-N08]|nr:helix-turn-helix domain-containing protein [Parabacteroides sp. OttesenSCG-928-N08]
MNKKSPLVITLLVLFSFIVSANTIPEHRFSHLSGVEQLDSISKYVEQTFFNDPESSRAYMDILIEESKAQNDTEMAAFALGKKVEYYCYQFDTDSIWEAAEIAELYARENKQYTHLFGIQLITIQRMCIEDNFANAIKKGEQMRAEAIALNNYRAITDACLSLGYTYQSMNLPEDALKEYKEALSFLLMSDQPSNHSYMDICRAISDVYTTQAFVPDSTIAYCNLIRQKLDELTLAGKSDKFQNFFIISGIDLAEAYIEKGDPDQAKHYMDQVDALYSDSWLNVYKEAWSKVKFEYYTATGDHEKAHPYINEMIDFQKKYDVYDPGRYNMLAKNLYMLGRNKEALDIYVDLHEQMRLQRIDQYQSQISQLRLLFDIDKLELRAERDKLQLEKMRDRQIGLVVILLLLVALAVVILIYMQRIRKKNIGLVQRIREQDRMEEMMESQRAELESLRLLKGTKEDDATQPEASEESQLIVRLKAYLKEHPAYTDPDMNRKTLAELLGTNESYLRTAIKETLGFTFTEYMNELRLAHAKKLLTDIHENDTIETIAFESGFKTRSTFHRQFREKYEISPDEYRKLIRKMQ